MEGGGERGESKASSDGAKSPEPGNAGDDSGTSAPSAAARYYGCIFCRRGFSTAQALGGHMNIHRKERSRIHMEVAPPQRRAVEGYHPYVREPRHGPSLQESCVNYVVYFPEPSASAPAPASMGLQRTRKPAAAEEERKRDEDGGLDLELRLGHG